MNLTELLNPEIIGMLFIFFARIIDVSLGTIRIILISRGYRHIAPILGFFEILVWLTAISKVINNLNGLYSYLAYAGGFAMGNYVGMLLEEKISIGYQSIRIITSKMISALPLMLREEGFGVTTADGHGLKGDINILFTVVPKGRVKSVLEIVNLFEPAAFVTVEDVKYQHAGFLGKRNFFNLFGRMISKKK